MLPESGSSEATSQDKRHIKPTRARMIEGEEMEGKKKEKKKKKKKSHETTTACLTRNSNILNGGDMDAESTNTTAKGSRGIIILTSIPSIPQLRWEGREEPRVYFQTVHKECLSFPGIFNFHMKLPIYFIFFPFGTMGKSPNFPWGIFLCVAPPTQQTPCCDRMEMGRCYISPTTRLND